MSEVCEVCKAEPRNKSEAVLIRKVGLCYKCNPSGPRRFETEDLGKYPLIYGEVCIGDTLQRFRKEPDP